MFILSSISSGLELWSANLTSIYENSESNFFKNITFWSEMSNNWPNDLPGTNVCKVLQKLCWKLLSTILQYYSSNF